MVQRSFQDPHQLICRTSFLSCFPLEFCHSLPFHSVLNKEKRIIIIFFLKLTIYLPVLVFHKRIRLSVPTETRKRPSQVNDNPWTYPLCAVVCSTPAWFLPLCWSIEKRTLLAARISHISSRLSMEPEANWYSCDGDHFTERTEDPWLLNSWVLEPLLRSQR